MTTFIRSLTAALLVVFALAVPAQAQVTISSTTLDEAVSSSSQLFVIVASASGIEANDLLVIDREAMRVSSVSGTRVNVQRGVEGTAARAHGDNAIVYHGPSAQFARDEVVNGSVCTSASEAYLPRIVLPTGNKYVCTNTVWNQVGADVGVVYVTCRTLLIADSVDQSCFTADRDYVVINITEVHATAESTSTGDLLVTRQQGTEAPASGDALMSADFNLTSTAQTPVTASLTTTAADRILDAGDRIGLDFQGTIDEAVGIVVTITLAPR